MPTNRFTTSQILSRLPKLQATSNAALYRQVKTALLKVLESGDLAPGQTLPNETDLAAQLEVSIGTLRKAVDELVHEHILVRRQGKGTYVASHSTDRFLFQFFHVEPRPNWRETRVVTEQEYPFVDNLSFETSKANDYEAAALRLRAGESVFRIRNLLSLGGERIMHDEIVLSAALFKDLTPKRFEERPSTIYHLYQTDHGISVIRTLERARAVNASSQIAKELGLKTASPVMEIHRIATTFGERPVELRISSLNTQAHDYVNHLSKTPWSRTGAGQ